MKRDTLQRQERPAAQLIEEAVHLLRACPARSLAAYYLGSLPCVLGLLYFWADMARSPFADEHLSEAALGVAALFIWMKSWQAVFARQLLDSLTGEVSRWDWRRYGRTIVAQAVLQPTALFLVPLAAVPIVPLAWVYAFYQNATVFSADETGSVRALVKRSRLQASLWPRQNHALLGILLGFGLVVLLNWATVTLLAPLAVKTLLGVESVFSRSPLSMFNTTFFAVMAGLSYLCVDPILKGVYALRCFYGESLKTGADLQAELKQWSLPAPGVALLFFLLMLPCGAAGQETESSAAAPPPSAATATVAPQDLDRAIGEVLRERKYTWRMPREHAARTESASKGVIGRFIERAMEAVKDWGQKFADWLGRLVRKLFQTRRPIGSPSLGYGWMNWLYLLIYVLVALAVVGIFMLARRMIRNRRRATAPLAAEAVQPVLDIADENIGPDQLPEDGWTSLARELLGRGELRLALRAFYLASLAQLAARNLITITRFKSNRDYERELLRRAHSWPDLLARFSQNVSTFDRIWYGTHPVDQLLVTTFAENVDAMRQIA